jgi:hypothetical protein
LPCCFWRAWVCCTLARRSHTLKWMQSKTHLTYQGRCIRCTRKMHQTQTHDVRRQPEQHDKPKMEHFMYHPERTRTGVRRVGIKCQGFLRPLTHISNLRRAGHLARVLQAFCDRTCLIYELTCKGKWSTMSGHALKCKRNATKRTCAEGC